MLSGALTGAPWATSQVYQHSVDGIHGSFPTKSHEICSHVAWGEPGQLLVIQVFGQLELPTQCFQYPEREIKVLLQRLSAVTTGVIPAEEATFNNTADGGIQDGAVRLTGAAPLHREFRGKFPGQSVQLCGGQDPGSRACWWHR